MDLDDLLEREGIDTSEVDDTLAWARTRAEELVVGLDSDPELAALLEGGATPTPTGEPDAELDLDTTQPRSVDEAAAELAEAEAQVAVAQAEFDDAGAEDPPELDPLAGIDFDDLPGVDEDEDQEPLAPALVEPPLGNRDHEPEEGVDSTIPSMQAPLSVDETLSMSTEGFSVDQTQRAANPLDAAPEGALHEVSPTHIERTDGGEAADALASAAEGREEDEEEIEEFEEFEILDDDDLELVEDDDDDDDEVDAASIASSTTPAGEVPEWQAALTSAQLGGGREADEDSGLLPRPESPEPSEPSEPSEPTEASEPAGSSAAEAEGQDEDESDVDLGDD